MPRYLDPTHLTLFGKWTLGVWAIDVFDLAAMSPEIELEPAQAILKGYPLLRIRPELT
jgi:hypothetical protein